MTEYYRCIKLPSQPLMSRTKCIARGLNPTQFDKCIGCMYTVNRKAIRLNPEEEIKEPTKPKMVKRIKKH
jgi:hypothetical protein